MLFHVTRLSPLCRRPAPSARRLQRSLGTISGDPVITAVEARNHRALGDTLAGFHQDVVDTSADLYRQTRQVERYHLRLGFALGIVNQFRKGTALYRKRWRSHHRSAHQGKKAESETHGGLGKWNG